MRHSGFTLIEILVVVTIGVVLSTAGFLSYNAYKNRRDVELSQQQLAATVKEVQQRSVTQEDGNRWSIRLSASSTGADTYEVYSGSTYTTSSVERSYSFRRAVRFSEPSGDRNIDLQFEPVSGKLANRKIISITHENTDFRAADIIVSSLGLVTTRIHDNLAGYWHLDEGTSTSTADASGQGHAGTIQGTTWQAASSCVSGQCLDFSGSSYVDVGNSNELSGEDGITIEGWFYNPSGSRWISKDRSDYWNLGDLGWEISGGTGIKSINGGSWTSSMPSNEWAHVAATYDPDTGYQAVYINGDLEVSQTLNPAITIGLGTDRSVFLGCNVESEGCASYTYSGKMDELRIYNTALSSSTIKSHYNDLQ